MSASELAEAHGLAKVGGRPPLHHYLVQVWRRRDFTISLARFRIQSENERNRLGMLWVLLRPCFSALVYGLVFGLILAASRPDNFVPFLVIGVFALEFFNSSLNQGSKSIISNSALVQSLPFPRMVLPLATVIQQLMNFVPTLALMIALTMIWGARPDVLWLLLIPLLAIFFVLNTGVSLIAARLTVHVRDLSQFIPFISRMIFYTSGVFFDPMNIVRDHPGLQVVFDWHPLYNILAIMRGILLPDYVIPEQYWLHVSIWAVVLFVIGVVFFWQAEERYGRDD